MRKPIMMLLLLATFAFTFTNCKKDKDDPRDTDTNSYVDIDAVEYMAPTSSFKNNILSFTGEGGNPLVFAGFSSKPTSSGSFKVIGVDPLALTEINFDDAIFNALSGPLNTIIDVAESILGGIDSADPLYAPLAAAIQEMQTALDNKDLDAFIAATADINLDGLEISDTERNKIVNAFQEIGKDQSEIEINYSDILKDVFASLDIKAGEVAILTVYK